MLSISENDETREKRTISRVLPLSGQPEHTLPVDDKRARWASSDVFCHGRLVWTCELGDNFGNQDIVLQSGTKTHAAVTVESPNIYLTEE